MAKLIYIVDDQPEVVKHLCSVLCGLHSEWQLRGFTDAPDILEEARLNPPDLVLVGQRVAAMGNGDLLQLIKRIAPTAVRVLLSARPGKDGKLAAAHQYLESPFNFRDLEQRISQALAAHERLAHPSLGKLLTGLDSFPVLPCVYADLVHELADEQTNLERAAELLDQDGGALTRVLQAANSLTFGSSTKIATSKAALFQLGTVNVQALVMCMHVFRGYRRVNFPEMPVELLWQHSCATAWLARELCRRGNAEPSANDAFFAGLTHDLGCLILMENYSDSFRTLCQRAQQTRQPLFEAERETLGTAHEDLSAFMLQLWGMPDSVVEAVRYHNAPWEGPEPGRFTPTTALYMANIIARQHGPHDRLTTPDLNWEFLQDVGAPDPCPSSQFSGTAQ